MKKSWEKDIRDRLKDYRRPAPEGLLDQVKGEMARRGLQPRRARTVSLWSRRAVAAAITLLIAGGAALLWMTRDAVTQPQIASQQQGAVSTPEHTTTLHCTDDEQAYTPGTDQADKPSILAMVVNKLTGNAPTESASSSVSSASAGQELAMATTEKEAISSSTPLPSQTPNSPTLSSGQTEGRDASLTHKSEPSSEGTGSHHAKRFGFGTGIGSFNAAGSSQGMALPMAFASASPDFSNQFFDSSESSNNQSPYKVTHEDHKRPVRIGLSVSYRVSDRVCLQSGLTYSYLRSDFTRENDFSTKTTRQKLHYVGIPVQVTYSLWHHKRLNAYVSSGGEVQKLVSGKAKSDVISLDRAPSTENENVSEHRPQFSVSAAAGVEYQLLHHVGAYVEPGVSYYFDNGSNVKNYYKDKKFNFRLGVGLRLHL